MAERIRRYRGGVLFGFSSATGSKVGVMAGPRFLPAKILFSSAKASLPVGATAHSVFDIQRFGEGTPPKMSVYS
ncbi:MAG: hypothetical protein HYS22_03725 [Deltaproteobacteria bacterium]|nr:hypothetical protein [Deltaproteobacteria bacterium]